MLRIRRAKDHKLITLVTDGRTDTRDTRVGQTTLRTALFQFDTAPCRLFGTVPCSINILHSAVPVRRVVWLSSFEKVVYVCVWKITCG